MKTAYVTTLSNGDGYLPGVEVLGKSLDASGIRVAKVVLVMPEVSPRARERLARQGWQLRNVEPVDHPAAERLLFPRFATVFTKLRR